MDNGFQYWLSKMKLGKPFTLEKSYYKFFGPQNHLHNLKHLP